MAENRDSVYFRARDLARVVDEPLKNPYSPKSWHYLAWEDGATAGRQLRVLLGDPGSVAEARPVRHGGGVPARAARAERQRFDNMAEELFSVLLEHGHMTPSQAGDALRLIRDRMWPTPTP